MVPRTGRRRFLAAVAAGTTTGLAGCSMDGSDDAEADSADSDRVQPATLTGLPDAIALELVTDELVTPTAVAFVPDADRRYVAEREGVVHVHEDDRLDEPLLDLTGSIESGGEQGLLGLELHPEFAENRRLFVRYSSPSRPGTPDGYSHTFVLAEFEVSEDGREIVADAERAVLEIPKPNEIHNAGDIAFGPDGYLYVPVGDSAASPDLEWQGPGTGGYGQDVVENLLGSVLRIDVDDRADGEGYSVPDDNPLVGEDGLDEYYAWGFRNPWRMSFDGDDLFVADVGKDEWEEVNLVERGGNYGWNVKEGTGCFNAENCPNETPEDVRGGEPLLDPIVEYPHPGGEEEPAVGGVSVIGGHVYRGSALSELEDTYVFGDLHADGRLFAARPAEDGGLWSIGTVEIAAGAEGLERLFAFGRDPVGELYVLGSGADASGLFRIVPAS
ncbi:PQQ-dependent sugar dehydrogenase [Halalkalicoccus ordinarius]|uniref:PQQ-dependent sugar dehydrogenase n=1 Tax=Halalkalicoccus ordinarius TaxID=3116651 RepID=UPI00300E73C9